MVTRFFTERRGDDTAMDIIQINTIITHVRFSVVLASNGRNTAKKRSHEIAHRVKTLLVRQVAVKRDKENSISINCQKSITWTYKNKFQTISTHKNDTV